MDNETKTQLAKDLFHEGNEIIKNLYLVVKHEDDFQDLKRLERVLNDFKNLNQNDNER